MKRFVIFLVLLCAGFSFAAAQDYITTRQGDDIQVKVLEVGPATVKYVKTSNPDGPVYTVPRSEILMIRFANGENEVFYAEPQIYATVPVYEGLRYRDYKHYYNKRDYIRQDDDPFSPFLAGVASYFFPGLGQCICGEWGRGTAFCLGTYITGSLALYSLASTATQDLDYDVWSPYYDYDGQYYSGDKSYNGDYSAAAALLIATGVIYVWNICDAVKMAKIKNMYYQDLYGRKQHLKLHIEPYVGYNPVSASPVTNVASGLSLKVNF